MNHSTQLTLYTKKRWNKTDSRESLVVFGGGGRKSSSWCIIDGWLRKGSINCLHSIGLGTFLLLRPMICHVEGPYNWYCQEPAILYLFTLSVTWDNWNYESVKAYQHLVLLHILVTWTFCFQCLNYERKKDVMLTIVTSSANRVKITCRS